MHPEFPFLAAGAVAIIGGTVANHGLPPNLDKALIGTVALVIVSSATADTRVAPLVHALGFLVLLASVMATVKAVNAAKTKPSTVKAA